MRIEFLPMSRLDLLNMGDHCREAGGNKLARRMVGGVKAEIWSLRDYPEVAPIYELAPGIRRLVVVGGAFLVFYRVRTDVEVLHIRRAERAPITKNDLEQ